MILSLLIPSTFDRDKILFKLLTELSNQIRECEAEDEVEILTDIDNYEHLVGWKRQALIEKANGKWLAHIDSDDEVTPDYIRLILEALKHNPDVVGFEGYYTENGNNRTKWRISKDLPYITTQENGQKVFLRFNNHLSPIKKEIALKIGYRNIGFGEDYDYALRLKNSGLIKTEYYIPKEIYHYKYNSKK